MTQEAAGNETFMPESIVASSIATLRFAVGLLQGLILYFLYEAAKARSWPGTEPYLFVPLQMVFLIAPVILVSSLGHIGKKQVALWIAFAVLVIAMLGFYDAWRAAESVLPPSDPAVFKPARHPTPLFFAFTVAGFYIAHSMVLAGVLDKRRIARYPTYFETAWKLAVQVKFSCLFVGILWVILLLGAQLFRLIGIHFLEHLIEKSWFSIPVSAFAFSCAMHVTDVRPAIVRGIRTLLLVLMSWLLPVAALLASGFLLSLPWTGLAPLWATRHATAVLLGVAATLVLLINAAFQNGEVAANVAWVVRFSARIAAAILAPIVLIGIYSLGLRVHDYGWTVDRISAAACLLVAACYAGGYLWAACSREGWLAPIARVNVVAAFLVLAVLFAVFSPVVDPARVSVNSQMARLSSGSVKAEKFDFTYLRFDGARFGIAALRELQAKAQGADGALIKKQATLALQKTNRWYTEPRKLPPPDLSANLHVWPETATLPASFLRGDWKDATRMWELPSCLTQAGETCDVYPIDFTADGKPEVLIVGEQYKGATLMAENESGHWAVMGTLPGSFSACVPFRQSLRAGKFKLIAPRIADLEIDGRRIEIRGNDSSATASCPPEPK